MAMDNGIEEVQASRLLLFLSLGSVTLRVPIGFLADAVGRRRTVALVLLALSACHLGCVVPGARGSHAFLACFSYAIGGLVGAVLSCLATLPSELLPSTHQKLASSAVFSPVGVGFVLGT